MTRINNVLVVKVGSADAWAYISGIYGNIHIYI